MVNQYASMLTIDKDLLNNMAQLALFKREIQLSVSDKTLLKRATGRFYTHDLIASHLIEAVLRSAQLTQLSLVNVIEPFCGDGRLVCKLLETAAKQKHLKRLVWEIELWDNDSTALEAAKQYIQRTAIHLKIDAHIKGVSGNSFLLAPERFGQFTICITNPPWEVLKPDRRELVNLDQAETAQYIKLLREQDAALTSLYPLSRPIRKFSGWGTNLARCGVELALRLTAPNGVCGLVSPASLLADQMSERLRHWIFREHKIHDIAYYAAEARLFEKVDQPSITLVASVERRDEAAPSLSVYDRNLERRSLKISLDDWKGVEENGYILPLQFGLSLIQLQKKWKHLPRVADLERESTGALWAGRELDETAHQSFLGSAGKYLFVKGRMIQRFRVEETPSQYIKKDGPKVPKSADYYRIAWRDVARPNQKRRMHATIIPPGWVTGNSLNVAYFRDENIDRLKALLGIFNSLVFEAQIRAYLATGHISLGAVRQVRIPRLSDSKVIKRLSRLVDRCMAGDASSLITLEVTVAQLYSMTKDDLGLLLSSFEKIGNDEASILLSCKDWETV
jgi:Alw26I/Eco31I/Esp3I family type II restriction m6 adenine DNA methyltransferase